MNFQQWQHHIVDLKKIMKSYKLSFNEIIAEDNKVAANFNVHAVKKLSNCLHKL